MILQHSGERLFIKAKDYNLEGSDLAYTGLEAWQKAAKQVLSGQTHSPLWADVLWNGGIYLWLTGNAKNVAAGIALTTDLLITGQVQQHLASI